MRNKHLTLTTLAILGPFMLFLAWPVMPFTALIFIGFSGLFAIEELADGKSFKKPFRVFYGYTYLSLLLWNVLTTWWVINSTLEGGIAAFVFNSLFMTVPFVLYRTTRKWAGRGIGYFAFVLYWISFEHLHLNWDLSWPWLTLGFGFASQPAWVQWYEYTGSLGGTLWVLLANIFFYHYILRGFVIYGQRPKPVSYIYFLLLIAVPLCLSYYMYNNYEEKGTPINVVAVQPNFDPYTQKFSGSEHFVPESQQTARLMGLTRQMTDSATDFVLWPETSFDVENGWIWENNLSSTSEVIKLRHLANIYPDLNMIVGMSSHLYYPEDIEASPTARYHEAVGHYDLFNTAMHVERTGRLDLYHKSKLVPGVEQMPYPSLFKFMESLVIDLGGPSGTVGKDRERRVFFSSDSIGAAPVICYESIYGDFMTEYIQKGANFIAIITNDAWWGNTPGHKQHLAYASLRAIENRRSVARSANTGISGFINQRGDILQKTEYGEIDVIKGTIMANDEMTFYSSTGDGMADVAAFLAIALLLSLFVKRTIERKTIPRS